MSVQLVCATCGQMYCRTPSAARGSRFCSNACRAKYSRALFLKDLADLPPEWASAIGDAAQEFEQSWVSYHG